MYIFIGSFLYIFVVFLIFEFEYLFKYLGLDKSSKERSKVAEI
jgi:hypothetical protein